MSQLVFRNRVPLYAPLSRRRSGEAGTSGVTAVDAERDLVVLKISAAHTRAFPLGNSDTLQVGESVYAVGNPQGLEGTFSEGIVSSIRRVGSDKLLQITAPISPGSSGGPVLNSKSEVIGVSVATFRGVSRRSKGSKWPKPRLGLPE